MEELQKMHKTFIENDQLWLCYRLKKHDANWLPIPGHSFKILIIGGSE